MSEHFVRETRPARRVRGAIVIAAAVAAVWSPAIAASRTYTGNNGLWSAAGNWTVSS